MISNGGLRDVFAANYDYAMADANGRVCTDRLDTRRTRLQ